MTAPELVVEHVGFCAVANVPPAGEQTGDAAEVDELITYAAAPIPESVQPEAMPIAFKVSETETVTGPE